MREDSAKFIESEKKAELLQQQLEASEKKLKEADLLQQQLEQA